MDQVFTAKVESRMGSRLLEEWKPHTNDKTAVPAGDELIEYCDQRELILSSSEECNQDPRPQFYRPNFKSPPTSSNKRYSKSSFALHNVDVFNCRLCQTGDHPLHHCAMFKAQDPVARRKNLQSYSVVSTVSDLRILSISAQDDIRAKNVATDITFSCTPQRLLRHQILHLNNHYRPSLQLLRQQLLRRLHLL